jgi:micrococcal nuclease
MYRYRVALDRVVDGDTVDLWVDLGFRVSMKLRFRLAGIDAPEMRGKTHQAGVEAKNRLRSLIVGAGEGLSVASEKTGKWGRWLGTLYDANGNSINQRMIDEGHARPYGA